MADTNTEKLSAAAAFLNEHEELETQLAAAKIKLDETDRELIAAYNAIDLQKDMIEKLNNERRLYQQYSITLATHVDIMASGVLNALRISASIKAQTDTGANVPGVSDADMSKLQGLLNELRPAAEPPHTFKIGDEVMLRSGGPRMSITGFPKGQVQCSWPDHENTSFAVFNAATLVYAQPSSFDDDRTVLSYGDTRSIDGRFEQFQKGKGWVDITDDPSLAQPSRMGLHFGTKEIAPGDVITAEPQPRFSDDNDHGLLASVGDALGLGDDTPAEPQPRFDDTEPLVIDKPFLTPSSETVRQPFPNAAQRDALQREIDKART